MSSEAVLQIVKRLGVDVKNHMSTLLPETVEKIQAEMAQEKKTVREEEARKHDLEVQRARDERARAQAAAAAAAAARPAQPPAAPRPAGTPAPSVPQASARPSGLSRPAEPRGMRRRDRKKKKAVDEKLVIENVRKTLASLDQGGQRRRHRRRDDESGDVAVEESKVIRATEFITVAELANLTEVKPQEVIATCMRLGLMATINKRLDKDSIQTVAEIGRAHV